MRISRGLYHVLLPLPVLVLATLALSASPVVAAESPWWHVTAEPVPTYLHAGVARNEVQELKVNATGGDVLWIESLTTFKELHAVFPYNATHEEVQAALEGFYGAGSVEVTGGPVGKPAVVTELEPYVITFKGRRVSPPLSFFGSAGCCGGVSLEGAASVIEVAQGRPDGEIMVTASNLGDAEAHGEVEPITLSDVLPAGIEAVGVRGVAFEGSANSLTHPALRCSLRGENGVMAPACSFGEVVLPYAQLVMHVEVDLAGARDGEEGVASVSGGGARPVSVARKIGVGDSTPFGVADYELVNENEGGGVDTQAGSHPFQQTTTLILNQTLNPKTGFIEPAALPKDLHFKWPAGLVGNPTPLAQCPLTGFLSQTGCPPDTAVGVAEVLFTFNQGAGPESFVETVPLFNLVPSPGEPARLGFMPSGVPVYVDPSVRSGRDYGITANANNISQLAGFRAVQVSVWGVPGAASHDPFRGGECLGLSLHGESCAAPAATGKPNAFLSLPTACSGPLVSTVTGDSWAQPLPTESQPQLAEYAMPALDGCDALPFHPSISVAPDGQQGSTPTGLSVAIHVPQEETLAPEGLATAAVKDTTVALPVGVQISPAAADGLLSCSTGQAGYTGMDPVSGAAQFTPGPVECASAAKVGTVVVRTPLLPEPLEGGVYLAAQDQNPFGSLVALYLEAENPREGVTLKLAGEVKLDERTGQVVTVFPNSPEVSFEEARLHFFGGNRAPLSTPAVCGSYTSTASIAPWSSNPPSDASSTFEITSGPSGTPCSSPRPFQPGFQAGTTSVQAGGYSPLTLTMSRPDPDQPLGKLAVVFPPGVSAGLRGVKLCEEPQAAQGTCPGESQIGKVIASAGLGGDPFSVETGKAYITGPYEGDPFGVEIVVPAIAGPFNLGTEIVRSKVNVDPTDAHLTVVSDPFPTILDGIPLQLQHVNVLVNRPGFVFNPTSLRTDEAHRGARKRRRRHRQRPDTVPGHQLRGALLQTRIQRADQRPHLTHRRRKPARHPDAPRGGAGHQSERREGQGLAPQTAPLPAQNAAEGLHRKGLRGKPHRLPEGLPCRRSDGRHPGPGRPPDGPGVLRLPRWREVPGTDHRAHRRGRRDRPGARRNVHQQTGHHDSDVRDRPGCSVLDVRIDAPQTGIPGAHREREPLQGHADHAHRIRRSERAEDQPGNEDRGHRLPEERPCQAQAQAGR